MLRYKSIFVVFSILLFCLIVFEKCVDSPSEKKKSVFDNKGEAFAGSEACSSCHRTIYDHFIQTAHNHSSEPASPAAVLGDQRQGSNSYRYDYFHYVTIEQTDTGLTQVEYAEGKQKEAHRMDMIIGSGTRGQSYLYWLNHSLFQLPVSYFAASKTWSNSPGFSPYVVTFSRPINARCLECHMTSVRQLNQNESYVVLDPNQIVYGISCEKCHGPGARHVAFHKDNPKETEARYIIKNATLSRQQQLDLCALCHSGKMSNLKPSFSFTAGDTLSDFFSRSTSAVSDTSSLDVHGNQYGLLQLSKCFRMSPNMTCSSCHNTHNQERGMLKIFSERCMNCHTPAHNNFCKMADSIGTAIRDNCISCHMPIKASRSLTLQLEGTAQKTPATLRSHYIAIYKAETEKMMPYFNKSIDSHSK